VIEPKQNKDRPIKIAALETFGAIFGDAILIWGKEYNDIV